MNRCTGLSCYENILPMNEGLVNYKKGQGGFIAQPLSTSSIGNLANTARLPKAPDSAWRCEWY